MILLLPRLEPVRREEDFIGGAMFV
jgi:hypothetical protein